MRGEGIVPVMDVNGNNGFGSGFGNNGDWAWIIILFLIFGFNGNRGFGGFGGNSGSGIADNYVLATDFATIERKLDGINNGICDSTFALNNTVTNGFFGVQNSLTQGFAGLNTALLQGNYALSNQLATCCCGIEKQLADCCCQNLRGQDAINFNLSQGVNSLQNTMCNNTRDVIDSQNAGTRAILDAITANRIEDKNAQIQAQQNEINALRLSASQSQQNAYLVEQLSPKCPIPAFLTCNPYTGQTYTNGYGYGCNGCGCNNF